MGREGQGRLGRGERLDLQGEEALAVLSAGAGEHGGHYCYTLLG